ncbi:LanC-like protein [Colletotrichum karsti]|uniref:LanC-like protein n=1 Tax=Colletotrichum karsti TaxID=1095194 RepID=A0A9P6LLJ6_9PEZI|nr:LanC-like protein [Colletotrichum karsti]KAF9880499.1 LanC-like protein [Colletotrichum karsti]
MAGNIPVPIESRFIQNVNNPNDYLTFSGDLDVLVQQALERIIAETPPLAAYSPAQCRGLFRGPTSLAYLFLKLGVKYPSMRIQDQSSGHWAQLYMDAERTGGDSAPCGLACESAGYWAVKTMMDGANASRFCEEMDRLANEEDHPHELLFGYAGLLYIIRAVESWRPEAARSLTTIKARMMEKVLGAGPGWVWRGKRYIGAVHGDIGILTQILLTDPKLAGNSMAVASLDRLLSLQREDGNWTTKDDDDIRYEGLVQDHFLAWSLPAKLTEEREADETTFPDEDAGKMSTWFNYWPGAAWAWSEYQSEIPGIILYTDV